MQQSSGTEMDDRCNSMEKGAIVLRFLDET